MAKDINEALEECQYSILEEESYSMLKAWRFRFFFETIGVSLVTFSLAAILFRWGFLNADYLSIFDVVMFYAGFICLLINYIMFNEYYSIEGGS